MNSLLPYLVVFGPAALLVPGYLFVQRWRLARYGEPGLRPKKLLTPNEVDFYRRLRAALDESWLVMAQVSMGALVDTKLTPKHAGYWDARRAFSSKICDFVVCDARTLQPVLIVELDDVMHDFDRDRVRDTTMARAGYRTVRFWSRKKPDVAELRTLLAKELALNKSIDRSAA